ncbi:MAG: amidohydrolase family protein, partial [Deltaproteobacteria bacterium]|nr:amidohydrolase family protein [Deltaproteobacteria bacterium]
MTLFPYLRPLPEAPPHFFIIDIGDLITGDDRLGQAGVIRDAYIEVERGRIKSVRESRTMPRQLREAIAGRSVRAISAEGATVSPGLIQSHAHLSQMFWRGRGEGKQLLPWLADHTWPGEAALGNDAEAIAVSALYGACEMIRYGATTVVDMATVHGIEAYVRDGLHPTGLRVYTGPVVMDYMDPEVPFPALLNETGPAAIERTRRAIKFIKALRGTGGRVHPAVTMRFLITSAPETAHGLAQLALEEDCILQTHASEQEAEVGAIRARFAAYNASGRRWHGEPFLTDNVALLHQLGFLGPHTFLHHCI